MARKYEGRHEIGLRGVMGQIDHGLMAIAKNFNFITNEMGSHMRVLNSGVLCEL